MGDGSWGTFYEDGQAQVDEFSVLPIPATSSLEYNRLGSGLKVSGTVQKEIVAYRTIYPKLFYADFSEIEILAFDYHSTHDIEVILIDTRNKNLENQPTYQLPASNGEVRSILEKNRFEQNGAHTDWSMIKGMAIRVKGNGKALEQFQMEIKNIVFQDTNN